MSAQEAFRGDLTYPLVLNSTFTAPATQSTFGWYGTLDQGVPLLVGPDLSTGRVHPPNTVGMQTAVPSTTERGTTHSWNVSVGRRLPLDFTTCTLQPKLQRDDTPGKQLGDIERSGLLVEQHGRRSRQAAGEHRGCGSG